MKTLPIWESRLAGQCNQCGLCCFDEGTKLRCANLEIIGTPGKPLATRCTVFDKRVNGMPIVLVNDNTGLVEKFAVCIGTPFDDDEIIAKGIGKGCSLILVG